MATHTPDQPNTSVNPSSPSVPLDQESETVPPPVTLSATPGTTPSGGNFALASGTRPLPEYELVQLLGRGGFGEVWRASGPGGFDVALKFIALGGQAGRVEMRSLELMKNVRHPHLLGIFGAWQANGYLIVAMELADRTLLQRLQEATAQGLPGIPQAELLEYLQEAAKGLDFLNERRHSTGDGAQVGIQHKDVKPQNILLVGGCAKVADFGLAKLLEQTAVSASSSMTPAYAAPEFLDGKVTQWSDQYCLAVAYCQLRGNRLPFEGTSLQIMTGHAMGAPDLTMLPEAERPAVARAMAKKPEQRWPSCRAFAQALAAVSVGGTAAAESAARSGVGPPVPDITEKQPPLPRPRRRVAAIACAAALLVAAVPLALFWTGRLGNSATAEPQPEPPNLTDLPPPAAPAVLRLVSGDRLSVTAGKSHTMEVRVQREGCVGPVEVSLDGLPVKVTAKPVTLAADQDTVRIEVAAAGDAGDTTKTVRLRASLGASNAERELQLSVKAKPAPPVAEKVPPGSGPSTKTTPGVGAPPGTGLPPPSHRSMREYIARIHSSNPESRRQAAEALGQIGVDAVPVLMGALKDRDASVRRSTAIALGSIGPKAKAAVPGLIDLVKDGDQHVRDAAGAALKKIDPEAAAKAGVH